MSMIPDCVKQLLMMGVSISIVEGSYTTEALKEFAMVAKGSGAKLTINATKLHPEIAKEITLIARDNITFII